MKDRLTDLSHGMLAEPQARERCMEIDEELLI